MKNVGERIWQDVKEYWIAVVTFAVYFIVLNFIFHTSCPMVIMSGFPCPGCGLTRSIRYLISGNIVQSLYINPMGIPIVCILIYFFFNRYILGRKAKGMITIITVVIIVLLVLYIWRMHIFFPNRVPYVYAENNILSQNLSFYEQMLHELKIL